MKTLAMATKVQLCIVGFGFDTGDKKEIRRLLSLGALKINHGL